MSEIVQFKVRQQSMYEWSSQKESRLSSWCNILKSELLPLTHVDQSSCKSSRNLGEIEPPLLILFGRSPRVLLSHKVHDALVSLTSWFPVAVRSMFVVTSPQCCHPVTRVVCSVFSSWLQSSKTYNFHDIGLLWHLAPRHVSKVSLSLWSPLRLGFSFCLDRLWSNES